MLVVSQPSTGEHRSYYEKSEKKINSQFRKFRYNHLKLSVTLHFSTLFLKKYFAAPVFRWTPVFLLLFPHFKICLYFCVTELLVRVYFVWGPGFHTQQFLSSSIFCCFYRLIRSITAGLHWTVKYTIWPLILKYFLFLCRCVYLSQEILYK